MEWGISGKICSRYTLILQIGCVAGYDTCSEGYNMCSWDYDICSGAIMCVVMVMVFAAVLLRGNFSVGTSTMGTLHEKLLRGNFPYGHPP